MTTEQPVLKIENVYKQFDGTPLNDQAALGAGRQISRASM